MTAIRCASVTEAPVSVAEMERLVADRSAGAVVSFSGDVRDHDHDRPVDRLEYEGHPTAAQVMADVAADIASRHEVVAIAVMHRVGPLEVGDSALVAAVSAVHRSQAFAACAALVDETKHRLPVWKHQVFTDGTDEWVNCA
ncbi:MAG: molybdenum cofactor biosynthesis protein MoaE [Actinobacteria bacterium]|nr:molybdenum cofactor biosynthesis protein MoaE [Actinomycetota bacterium]